MYNFKKIYIYIYIGNVEESGPRLSLMSPVPGTLVQQHNIVIIKVEDESYNAKPGILHRL